MSKLTRHAIPNHNWNWKKHYLKYLKVSNKQNLGNLISKMLSYHSDKELILPFSVFAIFPNTPGLIPLWELAQAHTIWSGTLPLPSQEDIHFSRYCHFDIYCFILRHPSLGISLFLCHLVWNLALHPNLSAIPLWHPSFFIKLHKRCVDSGQISSYNVKKAFEVKF